MVEGVTEFLPVSSTGHLIVVGELLGAGVADATFEIGIQFGAVLAVIWFYRRELATRAASATATASWVFWRNLAIGSAPAVAVGLALGDWITGMLFAPVVVAVAMIVGGIVLWLVDGRQGSPASAQPPGSTAAVSLQLDAISARQALLVGLAQAMALVPGVSRAAASIVGGMLVGLDRQTATTFSFYLAIPTLGGASAYALLKHADAVASTGELVPLALGTAVAFVVALLVIGWLLRFVANHSFRVFAVYRVVAGAALLVFLAAR